MYYHHSIAQELYHQQVAEWEREADIRRILRQGKRGRARSSSPAVVATGRGARPVARHLPGRWADARLAAGASRR